jgi:hypothetical protein
MTFDQDILAAALIGLELKKARLEDQIAAIKALTTGGKKVGRPRKVATASDDWEAPAVPETPKKAKKKGKRNLSPEARARIAAAQKKRWAAARGESV